MFDESFCNESTDAKPGGGGGNAMIPLFDNEVVLSKFSFYFFWLNPMAAKCLVFTNKNTQ